MRNGKSFIKRMITGILSAAMILTAVPTYAYAAEETDETKIIEPDLSYVEIVEDETINEESSIGAVEDYSNEENSQVNTVEENTNSNDSNDNEERGTVLANDEKQLNDEDDLSDELLSDPAESYIVSCNIDDFTVEYKDGTELKNGMRYVSSNAKSIKISVKAKTGKGIKTVTAKIGDLDAVVKKQGDGNFCNNGDGEYLITADDSGTATINGNVTITVESDTVYTVKFVDVNNNSIGVTPIPNLDEGPAAFIPNVKWNGTVKVFDGERIKFEYNVPDNEGYKIKRVTQGKDEDYLAPIGYDPYNRNDKSYTGIIYESSEINSNTSIYMYSCVLSDYTVNIGSINDQFYVWDDNKSSGNFIENSSGVEWYAPNEYRVIKGTKAIYIGVECNDDSSYLGDVSATIDGNTAIVETRKVNNWNSGYYIIKADESGNTEIKGNVVINVNPLGTHSLTIKVADDDEASLCEADVAQAYNNSSIRRRRKVNRINSKTIEISNLPNDDSFEDVFTFGLLKGYPTDSVTCEEKNVSLKDSRYHEYSLGKNVTTDKTVIIKSKPSTYPITVTSNDSEVKWGNSKSSLDKNLESNKINTQYAKDVYIKVNRNPGYVVKSVHIKGSDVDTDLQPEDDDRTIYKLYKQSEVSNEFDDHNYRIATGAAITVNTTAKPAVKVTTSLKHDGEDSSDRLSISGGANVGSGNSAYYVATNKDIVLTYTLPDNKVMGDAKVTIGDDTIDEDNNSFKRTVNKSVYKWTLSKNVVEDAWDNGKNIHFDIATSSKKIDISVSDTSSGKVKIYKYTKGNGYNSESDLIDKEKKLTVSYMAETYLYVAVDPGAVIKSVKAGSTVLKTGTETIGANKYVYYILPAASLKNNVAITVETEDTKIKVNGFKYDKEKNEWSVKQTAGTTARYKLTLTPKTGDYSRLVVKIPTVNSNASARIVEEKGNHYLEVSTFENDKLAVSSVMIIIDDKDNTGTDGIINDGAVVVYPQNPALSVPNIKLSASTDIDMTFALTPDKKLSGVKNLYYVVTAEAADFEDDDALKNRVTAYAAADAASIKLNLGKESIDYGNGHARRYKVSAYLVQVKEYTGNAAADISKDGNVIVSGEKINKVKTLNNQSTKNPYYETKLGLTKKNTTITIGQTDVLLATAKYSSNTTFMQLDKAELLDADGSLVAASYDYEIDGADAPGSEKIELDDDGTITLEGCPEGLSPGKYTLNVYPNQPSGTYSKPATLAVTFKAPIAGLTLGAPSKQLYKANGKAASIKVSAYYNSYKDSLGNSYKPANTKVTWSVSSDYEPLDKALKISNGTVTIARDYVLSLTNSENTFTVTAKAVDLGDLGKEGTMKFEVTSGMIVPVSMVIGGVAGSNERNPEGVISADLNGKEFKIYDKSNKEVDLSNVTVTVTPKDGLYIYRADANTVNARVTKLGTYTVKAVINDGGKQTLTQKFVVKPCELDNETPYNISVDAKGTSGNYIMPLNFKNKEATGEGIDLLFVNVVPNPTTEGALCADTKATVSFDTSTAKKVSNTAYYADSVATLKPKPGQNKIELYISTKDKGLNNEKYTINITPESRTITPDKKGYSLMTNTVNRQTLEFTISSGVSEGGVMLCFTPNESAYSSSKNYWPVEDVCWYLNNSGKVTLGDNVAELKLDSMWSNKGTYNLYVSLWSTKTETGGETVPDKPLTAPAAVKITLSEPKKPSAALKDPGKVEIKRAKDSTASLSFKVMKNATGLANFPGAVSVLNNNKNGVVNNFTDYFEAEVAADGQSIILKTKKEVPSTVGNQIIGWIRYYVIGEDGITQIECVEKITVTLKE